MTSHQSQRPCHQTLYDRSTVVVQQVDLINDQQPHQLRQRHVSRALPCHDVPFLRSRHQHLHHQFFITNLSSAGTTSQLNKFHINFNENSANLETQFLGSNWLVASPTLESVLKGQNIH